MKLSREVTISIRPGGAVEVATHGFAGPSCVELSKILEKALAGKTGEDGDGSVHRELQPEFYLSADDEEARASEHAP